MNASRYHPSPGFLTVLFATAALGFGAEPAKNEPTRPVTPPPAATSLELVKLLDVSRPVIEQTKEMWKATTVPPEGASTPPQPVPAGKSLEDFLHTRATPVIQAYERSIADYYAAALTADEIRQSVVFLRTRAGRKLVAGLQDPAQVEQLTAQLLESLMKALGEYLAPDSASGAPAATTP